MAERHSPIALAETQQQLGELFRQFTPLDELPDAACVERIVAGNDRLTPLQQAEIYRDQFWLRHRDALVEDFPALLQLVGRDAFDDLCRAYLSAWPPDSWTLRDLGLRLGEFSAIYEGFESAVEGPARDLARFETSFIDVFDGPDHELLALEQVASLTPEQWATARLVVHPQLALLDLGHPVHELHTAVKEDKEDEELNLDMAARPTWVAVYRNTRLQVVYRPIEQGEYLLLLALRAGLALSDACETALENLSDAESLASKIQDWFQSWAARGWFIDIVL